MTQQTRDISNDMTVTRVASTHCHNHHYRSRQAATTKTLPQPHTASLYCYVGEHALQRPMPTVDCNIDSVLKVAHWHCVCVFRTQCTHTHTPLHYSHIHKLVCTHAYQKIPFCPHMQRRPHLHDQRCPLYKGLCKYGHRYFLLKGTH